MYFFKFFFGINCPVTCHPGLGGAVQKYQGEIFLNDIKYGGGGWVGREGIVKGLYIIAGGDLFGIKYQGI